MSKRTFSRKLRDSLLSYKCIFSDCWYPAAAWQASPHIPALHMLCPSPPGGRCCFFCTGCGLPPGCPAVSWQSTAFTPSNLCHHREVPFQRHTEPSANKHPTAMWGITAGTVSQDRCWGALGLGTHLFFTCFGLAGVAQVGWASFSGSFLYGLPEFLLCSFFQGEEIQ